MKNQELANSFRRLQSNFYLLLQLLIYDSSGDWQFLNDAPGEAPGGHGRRHPAGRQDVLHEGEQRRHDLPAQGGKRAGGPGAGGALRPTSRAMVKQQVAQIEQIDDRAKLEQILARMRQMSGQVPPAMKPALEYIMKKAQEHLDTPARRPRNGRRGADDPAGRREAQALGRKEEIAMRRTHQFLTVAIILASAAVAAAAGSSATIPARPEQLTYPALDVQGAGRRRDEGQARQRRPGLHRRRPDAAPRDRPGVLPRRQVPRAGRQGGPGRADGHRLADRRGGDARRQGARRGTRLPGRLAVDVGGRRLGQRQPEPALQGPRPRPRP